MAYRVFVLESIDTNNWTELDAEDVNFSTIFSVADIADIANRKDTITKQISFKGSKVNNEAFGSLFHLNKTSDFSLTNRLFYNYNPLRTVDALIYEDSMLLVRGSLRVIEIDIDKFGNVTYQTVVTGALIDFKQIVSEKKLEDLNFADLTHHYTWTTIQESWEIRTERYLSVSGGTFYYSPYSLGSGYVYPFIDYGQRYQAEITGQTSNICVLNFRPAIYVTEYFNRIFAQPELTGYTYEIKGSQDLTDRFNSLIIPNNNEIIQSQFSGLTIVADSVGSILDVGQDTFYQQHKDDTDPRTFTRAIALPTVTTNDFIQHYGIMKNVTDAVFICNNTFKSVGHCKVTLNSLGNTTSCPIKFKLQLAARSFVSSGTTEFGDALIDGGWSVVAESSVSCPAMSALFNQVIQFDVPERSYDANSLFYLRLYVEVPRSCDAWLSSNDINYTISNAEIKFGGSGTVLTSNIKYGDVLSPQPIQGIKQIDFLKSVINLFNFYVYSEKENPRHLYFERYDDFYALSDEQYKIDNALDWSRKIDYTPGLKQKMNVSLPKKYLFTLKSDSDYINDNYQKLYGGEIYGQFRFTDVYGLTDEKKIELIFSPSPLVSYEGTARIHPTIGQQSGNDFKPVKSNIRILYYNGLKTCSSYSVGSDARNGVIQPQSLNLFSLVLGLHDTTVDVLSVQTIQGGLTVYPQCGNYFLNSGQGNMTPLDDLYFGLPRQFYFDAQPEYYTCPTGYQNYYQGQITSITNPDVSFIECEIYLTEVDVSNLDLKVPVFIDFGEFGNNYFKVLNVEYHDNLSTARVQLQRIV